MGSPKIILTKIESPSASIVMFMDTWQRISESQRKKEIRKYYKCEKNRISSKKLQNRVEDKEQKDMGGFR